MFVSRLKLKNWRNFRNVDVYLHGTTYILGPNASGKSNLLDVFRFLREVCKAEGGGLQKAIKDRDGLSKLRCLHARMDPEVLLDVELEDTTERGTIKWQYILGFKSEGKGAQRTLISREEVLKDGRQLFSRPTGKDKTDPVRLTKTYLEQLEANAEYREIAVFFSRTTYLHLVPQLLKYGDRIGGHRLDDDPFGQGFLERVSKATKSSRGARLNRINRILKLAVPQFDELRFNKDEIDGRPHLEARHMHHRPNAGWQREEHFSDGTLRLLGLLWSLLDGDSLLLLEEPELSLNDEIVRQIPLMLERMQRDAKTRRQVLISTHSNALLSNPGIDGRGVLILEPGSDGSEVKRITKKQAEALKAGLSVAEVVLPGIGPKQAGQLGLYK